MRIAMKGKLIASSLIAVLAFVAWSLHILYTEFFPSTPKGPDDYVIGEICVMHAHSAVNLSYPDVSFVLHEKSYLRAHPGVTKVDRNLFFILYGYTSRAVVRRHLVVNIESKGKDYAIVALANSDPESIYLPTLEIDDYAVLVNANGGWKLSTYEPTTTDALKQLRKLGIDVPTTAGIAWP